MLFDEPIAGSGHLRHESFLAQINDFQARWRKLFWTKVFFQEPTAASDFDLIPRLRMKEIPATVSIKESFARLCTKIGKMKVT